MNCFNWQKLYVNWLLIFSFISMELKVFGALTAQLEPQQAEIGDDIQLTLTVEGELESDLNLPFLDGLEVVGRSSSTNVRWINGAVTKNKIYQFRLLAVKTGNFKIPAIKANINGQTYSTDELTLKIYEAGKSPGSNSSTSVRFPAQHQHQTAESQSTTESIDKTYEPAFIERHLSKDSVYEGESVNSEVKFYYRIPLVKAEKSAVDHSTHFRNFDLGQSKSELTIGPHTYQVFHIKQLFIPQKPGLLKVLPFELKAVMQESVKRQRSGLAAGHDLEAFVDESFNHARGGRLVEKTLKTKAVELNVKPIPEIGRPASYKGLVGQFSVKADLNPKHLKAGDTATLTLTIEGSGLLDPLGKLTLDLGNKVKVYADKPVNQEEAKANKGLWSKRIYKYALVPATSGTISLGNYELAHFDPTTQNFKTTVINLGTLQVEGVLAKAEIVKPGAEGKAVLQSQADSSLLKDQTIAVIGHDLRDIKRDSLKEGLPLSWLSLNNLNQTQLLLQSLLGFILFAIFLNWLRTKFWPETVNAKRQILQKNCLKVYQKKRANLPIGTATIEEVKIVYLFFKEYLSELWGESSLGLTSRDVATGLERSKAPEALKNEVMTLCLQMDRLTFGQPPETLKITDFKAVILKFDHLAKELKNYV